MENVNQNGAWWSWSPKQSSQQHTPEVYQCMRDDVTDAISQNQVASLVVLLLLIVGGGPAGCAGALTAVAFDGQDGSERYMDVKDRLDDFINKNA